MGILDKIEQILYDLLKYIIPGAILLMLEAFLFIPFLLPPKIYNEFTFRTSNKLIITFGYLINMKWSIPLRIFFILVSYLTGHLVWLFGKLIVRMLQRFNNKNENYYKEDEILLDNVVRILSEKTSHKLHKDKNWSFIYEYANTIIEKKGFKSIFYKCLAKYNFYQSMVAVFTINIINILVFYFLGLLQFYSINDILVAAVLEAINAGFIYIFFYEYKRHWKLCGHEAIMSLNYYFSTEN